MDFKLEITLSDEEVAEWGIDSVLPDYLLQVAEKVRTGNADAGVVMHLNGYQIGKYAITDHCGLDNPHRPHDGCRGTTLDEYDETDI